MNKYTAQALGNLRPNAVFNLMGDTLEWLDTEQTQPTEAELATECDRLAAEEPAMLVRRERDRLLSRTDWWASSDLEMTEEQKTYRQSLRDITSQAGFPNDVIWPTKP
jgi:hypothetical protein